MRASSARPLPTAGPLPSGRHSLARETVLASQRGRLLEAMAEEVCAHGYSSTTVAHVVARAGVSRKTFYEHFADREACFLATYDMAVAFVLERVVEAVDEARPWAERARAGLRAFLETLAVEPAFTRAIVLEVHAAGPVAQERHRAVLELFAARYREINAQARAQDPAVARLPDPLPLAIVGAILEVVSAAVWRGEGADLGTLVGPLGDFAVLNLAPPAATA